MSALNSFITKRKSLLLYLIVFASSSMAQLNLDSLKKQIESSNEWQRTTKTDYLIEDFQQFESVDKKQIYDLCIDSTGHLSESIGLAAVLYQFDDQQRIAKRIGYNLKGEYYLWISVLLH